MIGSRLSVVMDDQERQEQEQDHHNNQPYYLFHSLFVFRRRLPITLLTTGTRPKMCYQTGGR